MLLNSTPIFHQNCQTGPKVWEIILRSWQVELSPWAVKIRNQPIQKRSCFSYCKLYACNLLTWGLNVVLRYLTSLYFCAAKILWASNVPGSYPMLTTSFQLPGYGPILSHFARHAMWLVFIDILKIVNWKCTVSIEIHNSSLSSRSRYCKPEVISWWKVNITVFYMRFLSPTDQKYAESSAFW